MSRLTTDQTLQISASLLRVARAVDNYRFAHLSHPRQQELAAAADQLRRAADTVIDAGLKQTIENAEGSIANLQWFVSNRHR